MAKSDNLQHKAYALDTNVLIHDPTAILNFEEHHVIIPMTVLEELDKLKDSGKIIAADCRAAIRMLDKMIGDAPPEAMEKGIPLRRNANEEPLGFIAILMPGPDGIQERCLPNDMNDNKIINQLLRLQEQLKDQRVILVTKDINMRLKARGCGIEAQDYHKDRMIEDVQDLTKGFHEIEGSFWEKIADVQTFRVDNKTYHRVAKKYLPAEAYFNEFLLDNTEFVGRVTEVNEDDVVLRDLNREQLMHQTAWGLKPKNIHQALALHLLLDPDVHLVNLTGSAGSGKTIVALAAAIEMTVEKRMYNKIIATRSTPSLAEEHGFLPGTEEEKMDPWLGAITDNIEALHSKDDRPTSSVEYVREKANIQFKALNYIRGRSFQRSLIMIDEAQNLTPYQMKAIITRAGEGSKVICLGNLAQIDTPYLSSVSSGLTYMIERFRGFSHGGSLQLMGIPRSILAEYAERNL